MPRARPWLSKQAKGAGRKLGIAVGSRGWVQTPLRYKGDGDAGQTQELSSAPKPFLSHPGHGFARCPRQVGPHAACPWQK